MRQYQKQKDFYNKKFTIKDVRNNIQGNPIIRWYENELIEKSNVYNADKVLEVGCGVGNFLEHFAERNNSVFATDISDKTLIENSKNKKNIYFFCSNGSELPLLDKSIDIVFVKDFLHHVDSLDRFLNEVYRILVTNGKFVLIEANPLNPQMALIGLRYFSIDQGVFKNPGWILRKKISDVGFVLKDKDFLEFLPRSILFYYKSPIVKYCSKYYDNLIDIIRIIESFSYSNLRILRPFFGFIFMCFEKKQR